MAAKLESICVFPLYASLFAMLEMTSSFSSNSFLISPFEEVLNFFAMKVIRFVSKNSSSEL